MKKIKEERPSEPLLAVRTPLAAVIVDGSVSLFFE
jgi:hypothetical protein